MSTIRVGDLKPGQIFSWIPRAWYGDCKLNSKEEKWDLSNMKSGRAGRQIYYDLNFTTVKSQITSTSPDMPEDTRVELV